MKTETDKLDETSRRVKELEKQRAKEAKEWEEKVCHAI